MNIRFTILLVAVSTLASTGEAVSISNAWIYKTATNVTQNILLTKDDPPPASRKDETGGVKRVYYVEGKELGGYLVKAVDTKSGLVLLERGGETVRVTFTQGIVTTLVASTRPMNMRLRIGSNIFNDWHVTAINPDASATLTNQDGRVHTIPYQAKTE